jgi:hypothetical protein
MVSSILTVFEMRRGAACALMAVVVVARTLPVYIGVGVSNTETLQGASFLSFQGTAHVQVATFIHNYQARASQFAID